MRILCVSAPLPGHLDWGGYLATAAELSARGHEVLWASGSEVASVVGHAGIPFRHLQTTGWRWPPPPPLRPSADLITQEFRQKRQLRALDQWLDIERVSRAVQELGTLVDSYQPDVLISEMFIAAAGIVAEQRTIPFIVAGWPAPYSRTTGNSSAPIVQFARNRLQTLLERCDVAGVNWTESGPPALRSPHVHISYWSAPWFGQSEHDHDGSPTRHVGGTAAPALPPLATLPSPDGAPWILITLGTSFNQDPVFFVNSATAAAAMHCVPVVVSGCAPNSPLHNELEARLPASARLLRHVDFRTVLPYTSASIHHGGAGTTHALVTCAVPQVVAPHAADQGQQAQGVARTGIGFHVAPRQATVSNLSRALAELLPDRSPYRDAAHSLQAGFAKLGGTGAAASLVEQISR